MVNVFVDCCVLLTSSLRLLLCPAGKTQSNIEPFGQYPLQVNGFNNLDECLEGAMVETEVEAAHAEQTVPSGQEVSVCVCVCVCVCV